MHISHQYIFAYLSSTGDGDRETDLSKKQQIRIGAKKLGCQICEHVYVLRTPAPAVTGASRVRAATASAS